jgi:predicted transcriptional regulator
MRTSSGDSFGSFLATVEGSENKTTTGRKTQVELLKTLATSGSQPVQTLLGLVSVDVIEFAQTLQQIQEAGLVSIKGTGSNQMAELTPQGSMLMKLNIV